MTTPQTVTLAGTEFTYEGLYTLSGPELVKIYNTAAPTVGAEKTKRFGDKVSAVKRTWAVLTKVAEGATVASAPSEVMKAADKQSVAQEINQLNDDEEARQVLREANKKTAKPKKAKVVKAPKEKTPRKPRGKRFVFPKGDELKEVRKGTFRAKLVQLLSREQGATFAQCLAATWGQKEDMDAETAEKTCYEAMRLLHYYVGYAMRHLDDSANPHIQIYF